MYLGFLANFMLWKKKMKVCCWMFDLTTCTLCEIMKSHFWRFHQTHIFNALSCILSHGDIWWSILLEFSHQPCLLSEKIHVGVRFWHLRVFCINVTTHYYVQFQQQTTTLDVEVWYRNGVQYNNWMAMATTGVQSLLGLIVHLELQSVESKLK